MLSQVARVTTPTSQLAKLGQSWLAARCPVPTPLLSQQCHSPELGRRFLTVLALATEAVAFEFDKPDPDPVLLWDPAT